MPDVAIVGSINQDLVFRVPHFPRPGETMHSDARFTNAGGKGANQAVACARLGSDVMMVGRVGADQPGVALVEALRHEGIDTAHVRVDEDEPTGMASIWVDGRGENSIVLDSGANARVSIADVEDAAGGLASAAVVLTQLETSREVALAAGASTTWGRFVLNPAPAARLSEELLEAVDILVPNQTELATLVGTPLSGSLDELGEAAAQLRGPQAVVVTVGERGAVLVRDGERVHLQAPRVKAVDTTAAGDAFCGALAALLAEGRELEECVRFAVCAGSLATTRFGAQDSLPTRDMVGHLLGHHS